MKVIDNFIKENKIASIACVSLDNNPHCFHCFYVFDDKNHLMFFKSSLSSLHSKILSENYKIAGSILPQQINFLAIKGVQFNGTIITENIPDCTNPTAYFHKKMPLALAKPGHVWCIQLEMMKMTDNTNILGKKLRWTRPD